MRDASWFRTLIETAPDVYFRFALAPPWACLYVSPAIEAMTGFPAAAFRADPKICVGLVPRDHRHSLRQMARSRRALTIPLDMRHADGHVVHLEVRTVPVIEAGQLVAVEGVARRRDMPPGTIAASDDRPIQQQLTALLHEVRGLLRSSAGLPAGNLRESPALASGDVRLHVDRMVVTDRGRTVPLTTREVLLLRFLLERPGRVVSREQLLSDVWGYRYTGDARTVDVHVSRLRRKLPSLKRQLRTVRHMGYRLDPEDQGRPATRAS